MTDQHRQEQQTESAIKVRQVTQAHANWNEEERGAPGKFSFQLVLDDGAEEYVIRPTVDDAKVILKLLERSDTVYFDMERRVLIPNNVPLGG
ncbi:MAG TPA: hypothetical protein VHH10_11765 [Rubrobacteraceae bacterium]|nr:hypothetical protein [Rubrobacteraceae bacterium]